MKNNFIEENNSFSVLKGIFAGIGDATFNYPLLSLRIMLLSGKNVNFHPKVVYRGIGQYATSIVPTTAIQFYCNDEIRGLLSCYGFSHEESGIPSFGAGATSAAFSTPSEHIILSQQRNKSGTMEGIREILKTHGVRGLWRGFSAKSIRDGSYAYAMLYGVDRTKTHLNSIMECQSDIPAHIVTGFIAAGLTQPFDVLGVKMQCTPYSKSVYGLAKSIYRSYGWRGFYLGFPFRSISIISGLFVMRYTARLFEENFSEHLSSIDMVAKVKNAEHISVPKSIFFGAITGFAEIIVGHPQWVIKTRYQRGYPLIFSLPTLYKGFWANAVNEVSIITSQVMFSVFLEQHIFSLTSCSTNTRKILAGLSGGAFSTLITTPFELIMTLQHKQNKSFSEVATDLVKKHGVQRAYVGTIGTGLREAFFASGYYAVAPLLNRWINDNYTQNKLISGFLSGTAAAIAPALVSHPFDTIKTEQQAFADEARLNISKAAKNIFQQRGYAGFFKGFLPRASRTVTATIIMTNTLETLKNNFSPT